jgi:cell division protein FtsQ
MTPTDLLTQPRAETADVPAESTKRGARLRRVAVIGALGASAVTAGAVWLMYGSPFFEVRQVQVTGAPTSMVESVTAATGVATGGALASVDTSEVTDRVAALPEVESVTVRREYPHTVVVDVTPRTVVGVAPVVGGVELIGSDGTTMGTAPEAEPGQPQVRASGPDRQLVAQAFAALSGETAAAVEWGHVNGGVVEFMLRDGRGFVRWGPVGDETMRAKSLAVLLASDEDARWFDLTRAGTPITRADPPAGTVIPGVTPTPTPTPSSATAGDAAGDTAAVPAGEVPADAPAGGEQPAGLVAP